MRQFKLYSVLVIGLQSVNFATMYSADASTTYPTISWQDLSQNLDKVSSSGPWYLINVLPHDIHIDCAIPGSINIPTHKLAKKLASDKKWPRSRTIVIYCAGLDCPLSKYAYQTLKGLGFVDVTVLEGGIRQWTKSMQELQGVCKSGYLLG